MTRPRPVAALLLGLALVPLACANVRRAEPPSAPTAKALRVGLSPGSPPLVFRRAGQLTGIEVDLARHLAADLGRPLRLVPLPWQDLIPALLDNRIDIIMSGMTITSGREVRIAFGDPYLSSGLMALMRRRDSKTYDSPEAVTATAAYVGVKANTTAARFVRDRFRSASIYEYETSRAAVEELRQRRIDLFVNDAPIVIWFASENEADLVPLRTLLNHESLGWGFRRTDDALRGAANAALARWKSDGTLARIVKQWLPYWP